MATVRADEATAVLPGGAFAVLGAGRTLEAGVCAAGGAVVRAGHRRRPVACGCACAERCVGAFSGVASLAGVRPIPAVSMTSAIVVRLALACTRSRRQCRDQRERTYRNPQRVRRHDRHVGEQMRGQRECAHICLDYGATAVTTRPRSAQHGMADARRTRSPNVSGKGATHRQWR